MSPIGQAARSRMAAASSARMGISKTMTIPTNGGMTTWHRSRNVTLAPIFKQGGKGLPVQVKPDRQHHQYRYDDDADIDKEFQLLEGGICRVGFMRYAKQRIAGFLGGKGI